MFYFISIAYRLQDGSFQFELTISVEIRFIHTISLRVDLYIKRRVTERSTKTSSFMIKLDQSEKLSAKPKP